MQCPECGIDDAYVERLEQENETLKALRDELFERLKAALRHVVRTGSIITSGQQAIQPPKVKLIGDANGAEARK